MLRAYACGSTSHRLDHVFRGHSRENRVFPSNVFLLERGGQRILFDTGYAAMPWDAGLAAALYRKLLPPVISQEETAARQLAADGVDPVSITHIVLSHLHPDHIGGVKDFPNAQIVLSAATAASLHHHRLSAGILPRLLPDDFADRSHLIVQPEAFSDHESLPLRVAPLQPMRPDVYLVDLPGHAAGHLGLLIDDTVLLAGDAGWGLDLLACTPHMRALPRTIQDNADHYISTAEKLADLSAQGLRVVCSHDAAVDRVLLP